MWLRDDLVRVGGGDEPTVGEREAAREEIGRGWWGYLVIMGSSEAGMNGCLPNQRIKQGRFRHRGMEMFVRTGLSSGWPWPA